MSSKKMPDDDFDKAIKDALIELQKLEQKEIKDYSLQVKKVKEILEEKYKNLPATLSALLSNKEVNIYECIADLLTSPEDIKQAIMGIGEKHDRNISTVVKYANIFSKVNTKEKFKEYITNALVKGDNEYNFIINWKFEVPEEVWANPYHALVQVTKIKGRESKLLRDMLRNYEEAGLEVILDETLFFAKTKNGNEGTISEFVGYMVNFDLPNKESIHIREGAYLDKVKERIKYQDIITGKITGSETESEQEKRIFEHQRVLLQLLSRVEGESNSLPYEYWQPIENNPSFADFSLQIALRMNKPNAEKIVVEMLKRAYNEEADFDLFVKKQEMSIRGLSDYIYHHKDALSRFMDDPDNQFEKNRLVLQMNNISYPKCIRYFKGPEVVILMDYKKTSNLTKIEYIFIKDELIRKKITFDIEKKDINAENENVRKTLLEMANEFDRFTNVYNKIIGQNIDNKH